MDRARVIRLAAIAAGIIAVIGTVLWVSRAPAPEQQTAAPSTSTSTPRPPRGGPGVRRSGSSPGPTRTPGRVAPAPTRTPAPDTPTDHPLDPLTGNEIDVAVSVLRASSQVPQDAFFPIIVLREPSKQDVAGFIQGEPFSRAAYVEVFDRPNNRTFEAIVDLQSRAVTSFTERPGAQPAAFNEEYEAAARLVRANREWQAALRRRDISDPGAVYLHLWAGAELQSPNVPPETRILRALAFYGGGEPNPYVRPIEGLVAAVDMNRLQVVEVTDTGPIAVSRASGNPETTRPPLKPLQVAQPQGAEFDVRGHEILWQGWRFRYTLHPRDGLVLYSVAYDDGERIRPILHRASLSEIFVPYGVPDQNWVWRNALDVGDYGLGRNAASLEPDLDVPAHATFFDAEMAGATGEVFAIPNAVALYERDAALLWKRPGAGTVDGRPARSLVIHANSWLGNYVYGVSWVFHLDGTLEAEAELSGTLLMRGVKEDGEGNRYGTLVARGVSAPDHQHFLNFRLDFDLDGPNNRVIEVDIQSTPAEQQNGLGNAFGAVETLLETEQSARRRVNLDARRTWRIVNPAVQNSVGSPVGYTLVPGETSRAYAAPNFGPRQRAGFIEHDLWVTAFSPDEMYAAGPYTIQSQPGEGLPKWVADNAGIVDRDLVVWYTVGVTHHPKVEEYPVMHVHHAGFRLTPDGFFSRNPSLDLPPPNSR